MVTKTLLRGRFFCARQSVMFAAQLVLKRRECLVPVRQIVKPMHCQTLQAMSREFRR